MSKSFWDCLRLCPAGLGITLLLISAEMAPAIEPSMNLLDPINAETKVTNGMAQVTSVSQLSNVQPTDWAFQALQSLVERYGCIAGYPDGTYRGNQALNRYEFAAGLNACLGRVNQLAAVLLARFPILGLSLASTVLIVVVLGLGFNISSAELQGCHWGIWWGEQTTLMWELAVVPMERSLN